MAIPFVVGTSLSGYFVKTGALVLAELGMAFFIFDFLYNYITDLIILYSDMLYALSPQVYSILLYFGLLNAFNIYVSFLVSSYFLNAIIKRFIK